MTVFVAFAASMVAGTWIMRALRAGGGVEGYAYRALAGLAACSLFLLVASPFVGLDGSLDVLLVAAVAGVGYEVFVASRGSRERELNPPSTGLSRSRFDTFCAVIVCMGFVLTFAQALAPVTDAESLRHHLAPAVQDGQANRVLAHADSGGGPLAPALHPFFALALAHDEEFSAGLLSWIYGLTACALVFGLGRRYGGPACGWLAAAMLASAPAFLTQTGGPRAELAFAAYVLASLSCLLTWRNQRTARWLVLSAAFAGVGCAVSPLGYVLLAVITAAVLLTPHTRRTRAAVIYAGAALCAACPWLLYGYLASGGGGIVAHFHDQLMLLALEEAAESPFHPVRAFVMFPWDVIMRPHLYGGWAHSPGPLLLLFGVPGLIAGPKEGRLLGAFCVAGGAALFFVAPSAQHFLPLFLPMIVVAAWAFESWKPLRGLMITVAAGAMLAGLAYQTIEARRALPAVLGQTPRTDYLAEHIPRYAVYEWLNQNIPEGRAALTFDPSAYYLEFDARTPDAELEALYGSAFARQLRWLEDNGIRYLVWPETFLAENRSMRAERWYAMVRRWPQEEPFRLVKEFVIPRPGRETPEHVRIYEIHYNSGGNA